MTAAPHVESVRLGAAVLAVARAGRFALGFLATVLIAHAFGATDATDAFFVARILPITFMDWAGNILKVGFIPTHAEILAREGAETARRVSGQFAIYTIGLFGLVGLASLALAPWIVKGLAPGLDTAAAVSAATMLRQLAPTIVLSAAFLVTETLLNAGRHFSSPARGRIVGRVVVVVALVVLSPVVGESAMPLAFVAGIVAQLAGVGAPLGALRGAVAGVPWSPLLPGTRRVMALLGPAAIWMLLDQMKFVVDQNFASRLPAGQLAAIGYAFQILQVVISVTAGSYLTALFPTLSDRMASDASVRPVADGALAKVAVVTGLLAALLMGATEPSVRALLERGAFDRAAGASTTDALFWYAPGMLFIGANMVLKILIFLGRRLGAIVWVGVGEFVLNVALDAALVGPMGIGGLALASSLTTLVVLVAVPFYLDRQGVLGARACLGVVARVGLAAAVTVVAMRLVLARVDVHDLGSSLMALAIGGVIGIGVYVPLIGALGLSPRSLVTRRAPGSAPR